MFRQFSTRRVIGSVSYDWVATQAALALSALLYEYLPSLPPPLREALRFLGVRGAAIDSPSGMLSWRVALPVFVAVGVLWPLFLFAFGVYDGKRNPNLRHELLNVLLAILLGTVSLAGILYLTYRDTPRGIFLAFFLLDALFLLAARVVVYGLHTRRKQPAAGQIPVLVVGAGVVGRNVAAAIREYARGDCFVLGYVDDDLAKVGQTYASVPVLGTADDAPRLVEAHRIRHVIVALPLSAHDRMVDVCRRLQVQGVHVRVVPDLFALSFPSATLEGFGGIPLIDLGLPGIYGWRRTTKRVFDVMAAACLLAVVSVVMIPIALLIKLDSKGPVLFRQERIGENGHRFRMLKFRSMLVDADSRVHREHVARLIRENVSLEDESAAGEQSLKLQHDPRITRVGRFIRKTSLDELPQLINVLRGEMSLVGPRPPLPYEVELYQDWHRRRLEAIPGITGIWQVSGRNRVSFDEMVRMDIEYIERQSLWLDIKILVQTPWQMVAGRGAG